MADRQMATQSAPTTPAAGNVIDYFDTNALTYCWKDANGRNWGKVTNAAIADITPLATETWITGSDLIIPSFSMQTKGTYLWMISASKTAAGVAAPIYNILTGSNRSTADTKRLILTGPAQTAIIDIGTLWIAVTVRVVSGVGTIQGTAWWNHRGTIATGAVTGFANDLTGHVQGLSGTFDNTALGGQWVSLSINGGAAAAWTITQVVSEANF